MLGITVYRWCWDSHTWRETLVYVVVKVHVACGSLPAEPQAQVLDQPQLVLVYCYCSGCVQ